MTNQEAIEILEEEYYNTNREDCPKMFEALELAIEALTPIKFKLVQFKVIDTQTGTEASPSEIAEREKWAEHLLYYDIDCFCICEDGTLILMDDCHNIAHCPENRFEIIVERTETKL